MNFYGNAEKLRRRGQVSQAFTYIAVILVIGAIAALGAKAIISILGASCDARNSDFKAQVTSYIDENSDKGSVVFESLALPCNTHTICFVDSAKMGVPFTDSDVVISESVKDGSYNVFVVGDFTEPVAKAMKLSVPGGGKLCIDGQSGYVKAKFEGTGRKTIVSAAPATK